MLLDKNRVLYMFPEDKNKNEDNYEKENDEKIFGDLIKNKNLNKKLQNEFLSDNNNNKIIINNELNSFKLNKKPLIFTERICTTCNIIRPPLASHCSRCDNCIINFDQ